MKENGYEYVDLGLPSGTMWATCNLGANKPEEPGLLFQWGRTDGYKNGDKNHKFRKAIQNCIDTGDLYIPQTKTGKLYKCDECDEILDLEDDAAYVNMGGKWRMPTKDQFQELIDNTSKKIRIINNKHGLLFVSKNNGNSLFIPFGGYWDIYDGFIEIERITYLWTSQATLTEHNNLHAYFCLLIKDEKYLDMYSRITPCFRCYGQNVRGVFVNKK